MNSEARRTMRGDQPDPVPEMLPLPTDCSRVLAALKQQVRAARLTAQRRVDTQHIELH